MKIYEIKKLIPQRDPILMVDELVSVNEDEAVTRFLIRNDNYFIDEDLQLAEAGVIENIAQSASAFAGYKAIAAGAATPPVGYIGEVKKFCCYGRVHVGDELCTQITIGSEMAGVTIITGEVCVRNTVVAATQMKIFIAPND